MIHVKTVALNCDGNDMRFILALNDWQTRTVWPKNIKIENTVETKTPTSTWMPLR